MTKLVPLAWVFVACGGKAPSVPEVSGSSQWNATCVDHVTCSERLIVVRTSAPAASLRRDELVIASSASGDAAVTTSTGMTMSWRTFALWRIAIAAHGSRIVVASSPGPLTGPSCDW